MCVYSDSSELTSVGDRRAFVMDEVAEGPPQSYPWFLEYYFNWISAYHCVSRTEMHSAKQHMVQWCWCQPLHVQVTNTLRNSGTGDRNSVCWVCMQHVHTAWICFSFFLPQVCTQSTERTRRWDWLTLPRTDLWEHHSEAWLMFVCWFVCMFYNPTNM